MLGMLQYLRAKSILLHSLAQSKSQKDLLLHQQEQLDYKYKSFSNGIKQLLHVSFLLQYQCNQNIYKPLKFVELSVVSILQIAFGSSHTLFLANTSVIN